MNIFEGGRVMYERWLGYFMQIMHDVRRLLVARPLLGGGVIASAIVLGIGPVLWWQFFARFVDRAYSARGVGTMTSDLSHAAIWLAGLIVLLVLSWWYFSQTTGLSRVIAQTIILWLFVVTHVLVLFPITRVFLAFATVMMLARAFVVHRASRALLVVVIGALGCTTLSDILFMMTHRSITVGAVIEYLGVIIALTLLMIVSTVPSWWKAVWKS